MSSGNNQVCGSASAVCSDAMSTTPSEEPREFGHYLLLQELGRGAQGVVFLAEDTTLHRKVALKVLTAAGAQSQLVRDRFRREAELTSRFEHPGICGVHDVGEADGMPYIAMQYVRGVTLSALVEEARGGSGTAADAPGHSSDTITILGGGSKGGLEDVLRLVERAARALHVAHEAGLVHRDIKPANIMVTPDGHPVLLDFGLARDLDVEGQTLTQSGQIMGTPAYLAPEQIVASRGAVGRRTDVYALGVTLFECLTLQRPFSSTTWDQLFHEILEGAPVNPGKLNPRIPKDLRTVIEVAMDREPERRYATAEALAEDLRRVRSFEPIQAKADGPWMRLRKWSRRSPGRAVSAAAALLFVLVGAGFFGWRALRRSHDLHAHLRDANDALVAANYVGAAIAVAKAQELDPESPEVLSLLGRIERGQADAQRELDRKAALAGAAAARDEAEGLRADYERTRREIDELGGQILKERSAILGRYADETARASLARSERELHALKIGAERILLARSEALERALRLEDPWGGASSDTQRALSGFYLERWREALANRDTALAAAMQGAVELHDPLGEHQAELLGRGTLTVEVLPEPANVFLFRYEDYETVREDEVIPRLVPVPTAGIGRLREGAWVEDFFPGDPCLVIRSVEAGSLAEQAGLRPGDLVLRLADVPAAESVVVSEVEPEGCLSREAVAPLTRVTSVDNFSIRNPFDWVTRTAHAGNTSPHVVLETGEAPECPPERIPVTSALDLIHDGAPLPLDLTCLRRGAMQVLNVPAGAMAGIRCEVTAYPLILDEANRIGIGQSLEVDPGSYLLLAEGPGHESQRLHLVVERGGRVTSRVELHPEGTTPPGYVRVPPGPFVCSGDTDAFRPREASIVDVPEFFIARAELTNLDWYLFVNDPETLARIEARSAGAHLYLPEDDRVMAKRDPEGGGYVWDVYFDTTADSPVMGLTWTDVHDYLVWRNARAAAAGEAWRHGPPSAHEWEQAARRVDARSFPWGDRFDPSLAVCLARQDVYILDAPGGYEPRDESPYGVLDMAGSREEWLRDRVEDVEPPRYLKRGGHWGSAVESVFHSASHGEASQDRYAASQGLRLVARRP